MSSSRSTEDIIRLMISMRQCGIKHLAVDGITIFAFKKDPDDMNLGYDFELPKATDTVRNSVKDELFSEPTIPKKKSKMKQNPFSNGDFQEMFSSATDEEILFDPMAGLEGLENPKGDEE